MRGEVPAVSVVVPARNAESTLARALESLLTQSEESFEAIVVENGSSDGTAAMASAFAARDTRVRVERRASPGVSAARNAGIGVARGEWLLFLDADDALEPRALELLLRAARGRDAAVCGWVRVAPDGTRFDSYVWRDVERAFESMAVTCAFAIHCCLVRRELVAASGGFDESLRTCEDWDLWLRLARMGARFGLVDEHLALYHVTPGTASLDARRMLLDGLEVIGRAHRADPRVADPDARFAAGRDPKLLARTRLATACYAAGLVLGSGGDARPLLAPLADDREPELSPATAAWCIYGAAALATARPPERWDEVWPLIEPGLDPFLAELETRVSAGFARRARRALEGLVLQHSGASLAIGARRTLQVELSQPIEDLEAPGVERVAIAVALEGEPLGRLELPVCDGRLPAAVLADALAAEFFWPLLGRYFELSSSEHQRVGWERFLRELWDQPDWPEKRFYEAAGGSDSLVVADRGRVSVECAAELPDVLTRTGTLRVEATVGGAPVGVVALRGRRGRRVCAGELRAAISAECGLELAVTAVREALIGRPLPVGLPLRELLGAARVVRARAAFTNDALVLPRWPGPIRGPASRRAALPVAAARELVAAGPLGLVFADPPSQVLYEPGVVLWERRRRFARRHRNGSVPPVESPTVTERLPILMYHRVAESGPEELRRYRLEPAEFEQQLDYLRRAGYRGVTLEEWRQACQRRRPLPGRAVLITFDDGYSDFAEFAWPLLRRYRYTATVFLVAGEMGGTSRWDRELGGEAPLLSWREARRLQSRGVQFGSHTVTHPVLTSLSNAEVVHEAVRSRALIAEQLGRAPTALAYPYGDSDGAVAHLVGACGYTFGLTDGPELAELAHPLLFTPRIEVRGTDGLDDFVAKLQGVTIAA